MITVEQVKARFAAQADPWASFQPPAGYRNAAVLLLLSFQGDECSLLFTRRTETVQDHKGQVAFPGGGMEPQDADLVETALREAQEEIGLECSAVQVIGRLQPFPTI